MCTSCNDELGAISVLNTNAPSKLEFHTPTPPATTPHIGSAASNRSGLRSIKPAVIMPPNEWPHAMVLFGTPYRALK